jgi:ATP-dependent exoDNAse (exonuclease V) alpha subunit
LFTVSDLYVALTRARSHLVIVAHDRNAKGILDTALAAAIATGADE